MVLDLVMFVFRARIDQGEMKGRAPARTLFGPDPAPVRFDNGPANRQAKTHAFGLAADERIEKLRQDRARDPGTAVLDGDLNIAVVEQAGGHIQVALWNIGHGFDRITHQVYEDLLNLDAVDQHQRRFGIEFEKAANSPFARVDQSELARLPDQ